MSSPIQESQPSPEEAATRIARLLRHEVGDLLQTLYSTVAILLDRMPAEQELEQRLLSNLRRRAELCKIELDAVVELAHPVEFRPEKVDLHGLLSAAIGQLRRRFPSQPLTLNLEGPAWIHVDARALSTALVLTLHAMAQTGQQGVSIHVASTPRDIVCQIEGNGAALSAAPLAWLHEPFASTRQVLLGVGLALLKRVAQSQGGRLEASTGSASLMIRLMFPLAIDP